MAGARNAFNANSWRCASPFEEQVDILANNPLEAACLSSAQQLAYGVRAHEVQIHFSSRVESQNLSFY